MHAHSITPPEASLPMRDQATRAKRRRIQRAARAVSRLGMETLEPRTLMSATFDTFQLPGGGSSIAYALAKDSQGDLFSAGTAHDASGVNHVVIRKLASGASDWQTILDIDHVGQYTRMGLIHSLTADTNGNVFLSGLAVGSSANTDYIVELVAGATSGIIIDQQPPAALNLGSSGCMTTDASGNLYFGCATQISTTKGNRTDLSTYWTVRKWSPVTGTWTTLDKWNGGANASSTLQDAYGYRAPYGISIIPSGPAAGIYAVGDTNVINGGRYGWTVRKGTLDGSTWTTVDSWTPDAAFQGPSACAFAVAGDAAGNVYVTGSACSSVITGYDKKKNPIYGDGPGHWIVRKSFGGNAGTWSINDDAVLNSASAGTYPNQYYGKSVVLDSAGNAYVGGAVIRTNSGGTWHTLSSERTSLDLLMTSSDTLYASGTWKDPDTGLGEWLVRAIDTATGATAAPTSIASSGMTSAFQGTSASGIGEHSTQTKTAAPSTKVTLARPSVHALTRLRAAVGDLLSVLYG